MHQWRIQTFATSANANVRFLIEKFIKRNYEKVDRIMHLVAKLSDSWLFHPGCLSLFYNRFYLSSHLCEADSLSTTFYLRSPHRYPSNSECLRFGHQALAKFLRILRMFSAMSTSESLLILYWKEFLCESRSPGL